MTAERPLETGAQAPDVRQQAEELRHLTRQGLGVYDVYEYRTYNTRHDQGELVMIIEEGMPAELKKILAGAVVGRQVTFREIPEQLRGEIEFRERMEYWGRQGTTRGSAWLYR